MGDTWTSWMDLTHSQATRRNSQKLTSPLAWPATRMLPCRLNARLVTAASSRGDACPNCTTWGCLHFYCYF